MESDDRQFLLTTAWLFARHGQTARARILCAALNEDDPRDGIAAAALAELLLADGEAAPALTVLRTADFPPELVRAQAVLETRALAALGRREEARRRWRRYTESARGAERSWIG